MTDFNARIVSFYRRTRDVLLEKPAGLLLNLGVKANLLTTLSLISGLLGAWFLGLDKWLFVLFISLHLFFDAFDGVVARLDKGATKFGSYFDAIVDHLIILSLLYLQIYRMSGDYIALLVLTFGIFVNLAFVTSKFEAPIINQRTWLSCILLFWIFLPLELVMTVGTLWCGILVITSFALQIPYFMGKLKL